MADNFSQMNPFYGIYSDFKKILDTMVIKYSYLAEKYETFEIKKHADTYLSAKSELDTFFTYRDYSVDELYNVGITDVSKLTEYSNNDGYLLIPESYRDALLKNRRKMIIQTYDERNEYYRKLNGFPPLDTLPKNYHYIPEEYANNYGIDITIPIHKIQDYYNNISSGRGDYLISIIEAVGLLEKLREDNPDEEYLKYIGSTRISIDTLRKAKNFQLLYVNQTTVSDILYDEFIKAYEQARDYHVSAIFIREYRDIIPYYDQFIAMCIMVMTIEITVNKQFKLGVDRKYYNDYTLKFLYDAYGIPYNLDLDEYTQRSISQSLNTMIQKKSTDKVFYDITDILGFSDLKIYRYYLTKERKFDDYGVPVIATTRKFNNDIGDFEDVPDYAKMYDVYFQKVELSDTDFVGAYGNTANIEQYEKITNDDPFWWNDENTINAVWNTEYNFVESKYLSVGLSYKMTDIMYENILLLKLLINMKDELSSITFTLPKISEDLNVTLYDAVILLFCLMAKKHHLRGEIISIPTQVTSVLDYLHNTDGGDEFLVDSFNFNIDLLQPDNEEGQELIDAVYKILGENEAEKFMTYVTTLSIDKNTSDTTKITLINKIFDNIKGLSDYLQYLMTKTSDRKSYEILKEFYNTAFYSKEVKSLFTINENNNELKRTAKNYFEYLYYYNPKLYFSLFIPNFEGQYSEYITENKLDPSQYTLDNFIYDVNYGNIDDFTYATLRSNNNDNDVAEDMIYYYIDHIIFRMESYISNLRFIYKLNDSSTPVEELLVKLINFFKSFTVDMLGLDSMSIINLRAENAMKFFDEIPLIIKNNEIKEKFMTSYQDTIHSIEAVFTGMNDNISFYDKVLYNVYIMLAKDLNGNKYNFLNFIDNINLIKSDINAVSKSSENMLKITDTVNTEVDISINDKPNTGVLFGDKITRVYYSE